MSERSASVGTYASVNPKTRFTAASVMLLACVFGLMFLSRNAVGFLTHQIAPSLHLNPSRLGMLSAVLAVGWSISGWILPNLLRPQWNLAAVLAALLILLAISSLATAAAGGFAWLVICRLLCGIAGGPVLPFVQSMVAGSVNPNRRGLHMGLVQGMGGSLMGGIVAPVALIPIAERYGWRTDFLLIAPIALLLAWLMRGCGPVVSAIHHREPLLKAVADKAEPAVQGSTWNLLLCSLIGGFMVSWLVLGTTFFPVYLTSVKHVSAVNMSLLMGLSGAGGLCGLILVPYLSDHFGRRPMLLGFTALGALAPAALLAHDLSLYSVGVLLFVGTFAGGTFPLFMAVVPSESVPQHKISAGIGMVQAASELIGGVAVPIWVGWLSDRHGLELPVIATLGAALGAAIIATGLRAKRAAGAR